MYFIQQRQKDDCGFTCLKMILATLNKDKNYLFLPQKENHGPYSYTDLVKIGKEHGVNFSALKAIEKEGLINCRSFPFIATIEKKNGNKHAVIITKIKIGRVYFTDPMKGNTSLSLKKFIDIWDGTGLFIESYEKKPYPFGKVEQISFASKFLLGMCQIFSGVFAIIGVYFIKDDTRIWVPALFLMLAIIMELIMRGITYHIMKKLDDYYFDEERIPKSGYRDYIERYENYKKTVLSSPMRFIVILLFSLALFAIVLLNDIRNLMLVIIPIVLAFVNAFIVYPTLKNRKREIAELEDELDLAKSGSDLRERMKVIHTKAYNYSYIDIAMRYLYAGLIMMTALLTMRMCGISSFPYIIFYTCISLTLYRSIDELFSYGDKVQEYNLAKVKLNNVIRH